MTSLRNQHIHLWAQSEVEHMESSWMKSAFEEIKIRVEHPDFPCVFSKRAIKKN